MAAGMRPDARETFLHLRGGPSLTQPLILPPIQTRTWLLLLAKDWS